MFPKPKKIKSPKVRKSAEGESCTMRLVGICDRDPKNVSLCHVNSFRKGVGNKSHDIHAYYGCNSCHAEETANRVDASDILRAMMETQDRMIQKGLIEVR
jgi:hypothetical protein